MFSGGAKSIREGTGDMFYNLLLGLSRDIKIVFITTLSEKQLQYRQFKLEAPLSYMAMRHITDKAITKP